MAYSYQPSDQVGKLTVLRFSHSTVSAKGSRHSYWLCRCECGVERAMRLPAKSCGCLHKENGTVTHGMWGTRVYFVWAGMLQRALNPNGLSFHKYGGRGITVSDEWRKFENFFADMGQPPSSKHSIERNNNNGPYCKENCTWELPFKQSRNTRRNVNMTFDGVTLCALDWANLYNLSNKTVAERIKKGWTPRQVLSLDPRPIETTITFNKETKSLKQWAIERCIKVSTLAFRIKAGWSTDSILGFAPPPARKPTRPKRTLTFNGETLSLDDWATQYGISKTALYQRLHKLKWPPEKALGISP